MYLIHERDLTGEPHRSPTLGLAYQATVGQKILKSPGQKLVKSNKSISRFFFLICKEIRKIDSFHFTSFLVWTFLIFLAHCGKQTS